jgi:Flp pilus assembly pilin Flp
MRRLLRLRGLGGDERGVSVIELGLIAPVVALFIAGIIDLSQGLAQRFAMQQAVNRSLELLLVEPLEEDVGEDEVDYDHIVDQAAAAADVPEDDVTVDLWLQCNDVRMDNYNDSCAAGEDSARYFSLRIDKPFTGNFFVGEVDLFATGVMRIQ